MRIESLGTSNYERDNKTYLRNIHGCIFAIDIVHKLEMRLKLEMWRQMLESKAILHEKNSIGYEKQNEKQKS